jgi:diaminopimelate decarboxylase
MTNAFHLRPFEDGDHLAVRENRLWMDGADLTALAREHGTPLFVYSERRIRQNARTLLEAFRDHHPAARVCFASKACANLTVLGILNEEGVDLEVNSGGELLKAKEAGFSPDRLVMNGVAKSREEIALAVDPPIKAINVDSPFELERIASVARERGTRAQVALRGIPGVEGGSTAGIETGSERSKFGMTHQEIEVCLALAETHADALAIVGLHVHIGSQMTDLGLYADAARYVAERGGAIQARFPSDFRHLNIGGGFPKTYVKYNDQSPEIGYFHTTLTPADVAATVMPILAETLGSEIEVLTEPGRSMMSDAGLCLASVESQKERQGIRWLYLDTGYSVIAEAAQGWYFHMTNVNHAGEEETDRFRVVGPLCDSIDVYFDTEGEAKVSALLRAEPRLAAHEALLRKTLVRTPSHRELQASTGPGDIIAILDTGAYQLELASHYCGRLRPAAVLVREDGTVKTIRARDTLDDLMQHERVA